MMEMKRINEDQMVNKRLSVVLKGSHERLTMIQVPTHDWFFSEKSNELFHYTDGVFECYPRRPDGTFFPHHTLKVLEQDAIRAKVTELPNDHGFSITEKLPPAHFWRDVNDQQELEDLLLKRNKRHLQQIEMEEGLSTKPPISELYKGFGVNPKVEELLETGTFTSEHPVSPETADWMKCVQRSNHEESVPVQGCMTKKQFQKAFGNANEKVSSGGSGLHYTLWKAMAAQDDMAEFLCIMISLPFMYGFACERWLHGIDVMLEKKKGNRQIHMLRIIGLIEADLNTALKFYFASRMMWNAEQDGMTDEQWGGRKNRSSVDAAMLKLLVFECARIKKSTVGITMYDLVACFDQDLNTALKFYFASRMMWNAKQDGMTDEQWGGHKNRSSVDAAMLKLLAFECARIKKSTVGITMYNLVAFFDRIKARLSNVIAQRALVDKNILIARATVIERLRYSVKTGLGVSTRTYGQERGERFVDGEVQGKGDVPSLWGNTSDTLLRAHAMGTAGLELCSPDRSRVIKRHNVCFVDDNDGLVSADPDSELPIDEAKSKMQHSAQRWNKLVNTVSQTVAFHKSNWQMTAWEEVRKGELRMMKEDLGPLEIVDHHGGRANIKYLPPDKPNVGLGYRTCPDGNQQFNFEYMKENTVELCNSVVAAQFTPNMARKAFYGRLLPKNDYTMKSSFLTPKQCSKLDTIITNAFLPSLKLNRNMPRAVIFGPYKYGGMAFPDANTRQTQLHTKYLIQQLRWNKTVANDFLVTLSNLQLESGFTTPLFESKSTDLDYVEQGWLISLRNRCLIMNATLWIEDAWVPRLQRENDVSLMEQFLRVHTTNRERKDLSACLKFMG
ncbi:hypothetical protein ACHAXN_004116, partial [Cyclotella atomus]